MKHTCLYCGQDVVGVTGGLWKHVDLQYDSHKPIPKPRALSNLKSRPKEKAVENYLRKRINEHKGCCFKWSSINNVGVPDRVVILPGGHVWFIEIKRDKSCKLSPHQKRFFDRMKELGVPNCTTLYGKDDVDVWLLSVGIGR